MSHQVIPLVLVDRKTETIDTTSFYFQAKNRQLFHFKPGQFVLLDVNIDGVSQVRAYSISSQPNSDTLKLTIKRVENGLVSNWLIDHLQLSNEVSIQGIAGEFNIIDRPHRSKVLLISAGCGITPVFSIAHYLLNQQAQVHVDFLHCAKDENNIIYHADLQETADQYAQFHYHLRLKQHESNQPVDNSSIGRITADFLQKAYPDLAQYTVFLCGSHRFMQDVANALESLQFDMSQFFHESFTVEQFLSLSTTSTTIQQSVTVSVPTFGFEKTTSVDDNLLAILESGQLPIIGACRSGICGSCKCKIEQGEVESTSTNTLTQQEIDQGYRLACSTRIKSDVVVSLS